MRQARAVRRAYCPVCAVQTIEIHPMETQYDRGTVTGEDICCGDTHLRVYRARIRRKMRGQHPLNVLVSEKHGALSVPQFS